ncbi:hypothetical protein G5I_04038 [Acromyrmex echinatior]|uniref:Uncharacterized protein n=1 Tax=Acromyrmex echinatior TaxID=103372 RepID=F4WEN1_ACREC|nr:hypothetical protein G5I_04038 [Acromyrmex echinatior]
MEILPLIPLFLGLRINVLPFNRDLEYNYNVTKTITIFRDPLQVTQYTASITCHTEDSYNSLLCLLHDIDIISTLIFQSLNTTNEVAHEQYKTNDDWFSKYIHTMEIIDDKLNISTIMEVQLPPDPWNPEGTPVFREITQLKLIKITSPRTKVFDDLVRNKYEWIDLLK